MVFRPHRSMMMGYSVIQAEVLIFKLTPILNSNEIYNTFTYSTDHFKTKHVHAINQEILTTATQVQDEHTLTETVTPYDCCTTVMSTAPSTPKR